jgi:ribosome biogenesis GTPase / thiamine phosphate phosphatase
VHLRALGWSAFFQNHWDSRSRDRLHPARVVEEQRQAYRLVSKCRELSAEVTGLLRHSAPDTAAFPAVGDWVAVEIVDGERKALIHEVLPCRTKLSRKAAGDRGRAHQRSVEQILVANVDTVFVVLALNVSISESLVERYLGTASGGGAEPVVVLSKADLCPDPQGMADQLAMLAGGMRVHTLSAVTREGLKQNPRSLTGCLDRTYRRRRGYGPAMDAVGTQPAIDAYFQCLWVVCPSIPQAFASFIFGMPAGS